MTHGNPIYSNQIAVKNILFVEGYAAMIVSLYMKKLFLLSAVLLAAVSSSHAGVRFGFGLPLPPLPGVVIGGGPVYDQAPAYCPPQGGYYGYGAPAVVVPPPVYFGFGYGAGGYHYSYPHYHGYGYHYGHGGGYHHGGSHAGHGGHNGHGY